MAELFHSTLSADTAAIDSGAGGFSTAFRHLRIFLILRTTQVAVGSLAALTFNNDTGSNYDRIITRTLNAAVAGSNSLAQVSLEFQVFGASAQAGAVAAVTIDVPFYAATTFHKSITSLNSRIEDTAGDAYCEFLAGRWRSTSAISRVAITGSGGNLLAGSSMSIYGF